MPSSITINEALDSLSLLSPDDQLMVVDIVRKRFLEQRRNELAESIRISREEYAAGLTERGSVEDFVKSIEEE